MPIVVDAESTIRDRIVIDRELWHWKSARSKAGAFLRCSLSRLVYNYTAASVAAVSPPRDCCGGGSDCECIQRHNLFLQKGSTLTGVMLSSHFESAASPSSLSIVACCVVRTQRCFGLHLLSQMHSGKPSKQPSSRSRLGQS